MVRRARLRAATVSARQGSCVVAVAGQGPYPHGDDLIDVDARLSLPQTRNG
jgi:hypothetical protein